VSNLKKFKKLRKLFAEDKVIRVVGAHDGLTAKLVEKNGFDAVWASGFEISTSYAVPDANILTMSQFLERTAEMNEAVKIPVIADCDTGFGNVNNVIHMVKRYETEGIAAVCIEDKLFPKVNSFIPGRQELAPIAEFVGKIMAAKNVQKTNDFTVIARVEALIAGWGMEEALKRAQAYVDAGADAILIHSKAKNPEEIREFCRKWKKRAPLVVVPTTYPMFKIEEMLELGIKMVIYANHGIRAAVKAINQVLAEIKRAGDIVSANKMIVPLNEVFDLQGMTQLKETEEQFIGGTEEKVKVIIPAAGDPSYEESMKDIVRDYPVAMLDINGKSILKRNVETLSSLKIYDVAVVTGYNAKKFDVEGVNYIENKKYKSTSPLDSIMLAATSISSPTLVIYSDILFEREIIENLLKVSADIVLVIDSTISPKEMLSVDYVRVEGEPIKGRRLLGRKEHKIVEIGKDLTKGKNRIEFTGISYFSEKGIKILKKAYPDFALKRKKEIRNQGHFLQILQYIIDSGIEVIGLEVNSGWMEIRDFENYRTAHSFFAQR